METKAKILLVDDELADSAKPDVVLLVPAKHERAVRFQLCCSI